MNRIRVMIVEDSQVVREVLAYAIGRDSRLEVAASVASAEEALRLIHRVAPDVISMDVRLPGMNGLTATQRIMQVRPTPIVVVAASVDADDFQISMHALRQGAVAVVEKPRGGTGHDYEQLARRLCTQLVAMSQIRVIRQRLIRRPRVSPPVAPLVDRLPINDVQRPFAMIGIAASTGGPAALQTVLGSLNVDFPLPIALVQHMSDSFMPAFVSWLDGICPLQVKFAAAGETPRPGTIYVAPPDRHLRLVRGTWHCDAGPPINTQRPSATLLFRSLAQDLGPCALGVLLTGMGEDGAAGLKDICDAGGYTIAEDESTAVVYGMPGAAARLGAVCELLALPQIAGRLVQLATLGEEVLR